MDLRYHQYVIPGQDFYQDRVSQVGSDYSVDVPNTWTTLTDENWTFLFPKGAQLAPQGWKIHLSVLVDDAQELLRRFVPHAVDDDLVFKVTRSPARLLLKNSKYGDRSSSGKFITVYPRSEEHFMRLLNELHELTADMRPGPYVLSDRRWQNGLVYYRYGAFVDMRMVTDTGEEVPALRDPDGALVPDQRGPIWSLPDFVEMPENLAPSEDEDVVEFPYNVESALHFSNGGGVYKATARDDDYIVVLKEARPGAGIDATRRDAVARLNHESEMLGRLRGTGVVPELFATFDAWEHRFLAEEYVPGTTLNSWIAAYYPFPHDRDAEDYTRDALVVLDGLERAVRTIHDHGVALGDLQTLNVMVRDDLSVQCIDLECAGNVDQPRDAGLMTLGYTPYGPATMRESDLYGLAKIARQLFLPNGPSEDLADDMWDVHVRYIRRLHGDEAADRVNRLWQDVPQSIRSTEAELSACQSVDLVEDPGSLVAGLRRGILRDLEPDSPNLVPGDIRQFEERFGTLNVRNGGAGVCLALLRSGQLPDECRKWLAEAGRRWCSAPKDRTEDFGLFTGGAGLAGVLWEAGMQEGATDVMNLVLEHVEELRESGHREHERLTIDSGLSGILLQLLTFYGLTEEVRYRDAALTLGREILRRYDLERKPLATDPDAIAIGLLEGWTGCGVALTLLAGAVPNAAGEFNSAADSLLGADIESGAFSEDDGSFTITDGQRLIPYLAGGSAGTVLGLLMAQNAGAPVKDLEGQLCGVLKTSDSRSFYNGGLLRGTAGLVSTVKLAAPQRTDILRRLGDLLQTFLLKDNEDAVFMTGDFGYRLSHDLGTGSAGLICALIGHTDIQAPAWMPLPKSSAFELLGGGAR